MFIPYATVQDHVNSWVGEGNVCEDRTVDGDEQYLGDISVSSLFAVSMLFIEQSVVFVHVDKMYCPVV